MLKIWKSSLSRDAWLLKRRKKNGEGGGWGGVINTHKTIEDNLCSHVFNLIIQSVMKWNMAHQIPRTPYIPPLFFTSA